MTTDAEVILVELDQATDHVIQLVVNNKTAELEEGVIKQVQLLKKLSAFPQHTMDEVRLRRIKHKVEQQQLLISQALEVTNLFLRTFHELSNFNRMG